ncbi:MAG TPA: hypothetical protein VHZ25_01925 [Acidobacteriaceae bacterium]|jgi:hypothetical protein|nr:hypothetical protein [Acidobacteriaceae bacterium]
MESQRRHPLLPFALANCLVICAPAFAQTSSAALPIQPLLHDGAHDFDPLLGNFTFNLHYMLHPLSSSPDWTDMTGTGACYKVWDGRANLDTVELDSANGIHMEGLTLRLYDPEARQWRLYWANSRIGRLDPPQVGDFRDGHGDFYTTDTINGKTTLIRFDWTHMISGTPHFEQAFSVDGGKTWEVNWITNQTRTGDAVWGQPEPGRRSTPPPGTEAPPPSTARDGQHDFDFDFGKWKIHIRRLLHPLTGSTEWTEMEGSTVTDKIWDGRANLATVEADGPAGHLELLSLRIYDPRAKQWNISFATSDSPILGVPAVGGFNNGRGEFYDSELYHGRNILVRFSIWPVSTSEVRAEQAFSADGGATWEANWINTITRVSDQSGD